MTKLAIYLFGYDNAQTIITRTFDGQHWYMASKVCDLLGIVGYSTAVHRQRIRDEFTLEDHEFITRTIYIGGRTNKHVLLVNNSGMLKLIFQGNTPFASEVRARVENIPERLIPPEWTEYMVEE